MTVIVIGKRKSVGIDLTLRIVLLKSFVEEVEVVEVEQKARFGIRRCRRGGSGSMTRFKA